MRKLLDSDIRVNQYICSDINQDLINLWNMIKEDPVNLYEEYKKRWEALKLKKGNDKKEYYYYVRKSYNKTKNVFDFYFLTRTCVNGLIRYNSKNEFNTAYHHGRDGIIPDKLKEIIFDWSSKLNENNVRFICRSYEQIKPNKNDFVYLDPPYANTDSMYFGKLEYENFWNWIRNFKCPYILSFDGISGNTDNTYDVPKDLYDIHKYMEDGISGFKKLANRQEYVKESLYIKI